MCVIKKTIIIVMTFFCGMVLCFAAEENVYVEKKVEDNYFVIDYIVGNEPTNGIQADITYNRDDLSFFFLRRK